MNKRVKLVFGVGVNDSDYKTQIWQSLGYNHDGKQIKKEVWVCPFYRRWVSMLQRSYSNKVKTQHPTYLNCVVTPEWHYFMAFRAWMIKQDWEGKQLDKDLLVPGNKLYGPETCLFIERRVNSFITERENDRGEWPIGVTFHEDTGKFRSQCNDIVTGKRKSLGYYSNYADAHKSWLSFKLQQAYILAADQCDPRVAAALIDRYENYSKYFPQGA